MSLFCKFLLTFKYMAIEEALFSKRYLSKTEESLEIAK